MQPIQPSVDAPVNIRRKLFEFIVEAHAQMNCLPSPQDLLRLFGGLTDDVDFHLQQLAREGLLILDKEGGNGISLVPTYTPAPQIKVLGEVAGHLAQANGGMCNGSIALDLRGIGVPTPQGMFAVQVLDDRMIDAGIEHGDIALLVHCTPIRGDIVAIEEAEVVVLRRYIVVSGIPHFLAENPTAPELHPGWETKMQGVLWGLIRAEPCRRVDAAGPERSRSRLLPLSTGLPVTAQSKVSAARRKSVKTRTVRPLKGTSSKTSLEKGAWPEGPSGVELNEAASSFQLTEDAHSYEPWGERQQGA